MRKVIFTPNVSGQVVNGMKKNTDGWVNKHRIEIRYGNISTESDYQSFMGLIPKDKSYYARNSKGKMVPVHEIDWDSENSSPTHIYNGIIRMWHRIYRHRHYSIMPAP